MEATVIDHLTKIYHRPKRLVLDSICLSIAKGEIFGLLGPNGAGKTTLLKILATLVLPTSGKVFVNGYDVVKEEEKVRQLIGLFTGRERSFYFRLSGQQNLEFFGAMQGLKRPILKKRIAEILARLGLDAHKDQMYMNYSTGMKRKLGLARALLADPPIYLLDEPTSSLDPTSVREIHQIIRELKSQNKTILLATHNMHEAEQLCDRIGILNAGQLLKVDTSENLRALFEETQIILKISHSLSPERLSYLQGLEGVTQLVAQDSNLRIYSRDPKRVLDEIIRSVHEETTLQDLHIEHPSLEDVFIRLTKG
ncbi:MAG: ABC transporter ATP-binding protein [Candidatus Caldarchaeum sp.]